MKDYVASRPVSTTPGNVMQLAADGSTEQAALIDRFRILAELANVPDVLYWAGDFVAMTEWAAETPYTEGDVVKALASALPMISFVCTNAGMSGASEPDFVHTGIGATVSEAGGPTWTAVSNNVIAFAVMNSATQISAGKGLYLTDGAGLFALCSIEAVGMGPAPDYVPYYAVNNVDTLSRTMTEIQVAPMDPERSVSLHRIIPGAWQQNGAAIYTINWPYAAAKITKLSARCKLGEGAGTQATVDLKWGTAPADRQFTANDVGITPGDETWVSSQPGLTENTLIVDYGDEISVMSLGQGADAAITDLEIEIVAVLQQ